MMDSRAIAQFTTERRLEAEQLTQEAITLYDVGNVEAALDLGQQVITIYRELGDRAAEAHILQLMGEAYIDLAQYPQAIAVLQQGVEVVPDTEPVLKVRLLTYNGLAHNLNGDYGLAIEYYEDALNELRGQNAGATDIREDEARLLFFTGAAYVQRIASEQRYYPEAEATLQEGLTLAQELVDRDMESSLQSALSTLAQLRAFLRVETPPESGQPSVSTAGSQSTMAGDFAAAIEYATSNIVYAREAGDPYTEAEGLIKLGQVYKSMALLNQTETAWAESIAAYEQALAIASQIQDRELMQDANQGLGEALASSAYFAQAIPYFETSLELANQLNDLDQASTTLRWLGSTYQSLGEVDSAINYFRRSLENTQSTTNPFYRTNLLISLGESYQLQGQYPEALESYEEAINLSRRHNYPLVQRQALRKSGTIYRTLGNYSEAIAYLEEGLNLANAPSNALSAGSAPSILLELGRSYQALRQTEQALDYYRQAAIVINSLPEEDQGSLYVALGSALADAGNYIDAEAALRQGIALQESIRGRLGGEDTLKVSIFERYLQTYGILQQVLIAQKQPEAALEIAEQGRARALNEILASRLQLGNLAISSAAEAPNISTIQQLAQQQQATLVEYSIVDEDFSLNPTTSGKLLYIWVVQPNGTIIFRQQPLTFSQESLTELVIHTREAMGVRGGFEPVGETEDPSALLQTLYNNLIGPISDLLPQNPDEEVVFIPQGALFLVPFSALQSNNGTYLIEAHTLRTVPSIQTLQLTQQVAGQLDASGAALVVGNPTMPAVPSEPGAAPKPLPPLFGAEAEAQNIAQLLETQPLIGAAAPKSVIVGQMPNARVIHFATHGLLDDYRGLGSAIALAPDTGFTASLGAINGLLTAEEISTMNLTANLAVLSACDTGRGRITGDGVVGLSRAFIAAGVPSVVVSLWAVPDAPTAELMTEFYRQMQQGQDKAQALRQAMLATMQTNPDPRDWAAFTLIGAAE